MKEVKSPKKPLIYYYCIALAVIFLLNNLLFPKMLEMQIKEVDYGTFLSMLEEENIEAYYWLPEELFGKGDFFFLRANGDSMIGAGIDDGDLVLIRRCDDAQVGQIVVALTDENENTLKRFYPEPEKNQVRLKAENPKYKDIITRECHVQGVAVKVIKDLI